jgi:hypothetical protein
VQRQPPRRLQSTSPAATNLPRVSPLLREGRRGSGILLAPTQPSSTRSSPSGRGRGIAISSAPPRPPSASSSWRGLARGSGRGRGEMLKTTVSSSIQSMGTRQPGNMQGKARASYLSDLDTEGQYYGYGNENLRGRKWLLLASYTVSNISRSSIDTSWRTMVRRMQETRSCYVGQSVHLAAP